MCGIIERPLGLIYLTIKKLRVIEEILNILIDFCLIYLTIKKLSFIKTILNILNSLMVFLIKIIINSQPFQAAFFVLLRRLSLQNHSQMRRR